MESKSDVEATELPQDLAEAFRQASGLNERPETLEEGFSAISDRLNEREFRVTLEDMYQFEPTRHTVHIGDSVKHVPCLMDALIVAIRVDADPVDIYSESPGSGERIHLRLAGDELTVTPKSAVASFGLGLDESADADWDSIKDKLNDPDSAIPTVCSVINAFPESEAYERWAAGVSHAAVIQVSVEELFARSKQAARTT